MSFEFRYGMCSFSPLPSLSFEMTRPKFRRLLLMLAPSLRRSPCRFYQKLQQRRGNAAARTSAPVCLMRSEPARSTRFSCETRTAPLSCDLVLRVESASIRIESENRYLVPPLFYSLRELDNGVNYNSANEVMWAPFLSLLSITIRKIVWERELCSFMFVVATCLPHEK